MADDLKALYQDIILSHNKAPRGKAAAPEDWVHAEGRNPTCGDEVKLAVDYSENKEHIEEVRFQGASCAICTASTSMLVDSVSGKKVSEAKELLGEVQAALKDGEKLQPEKHGDLHALNGVHQFPARLRCASLPWDVLEKAFKEDQDQ